MDHLPFIQSPYNPVVVPYLGGNFDGGTFANFAARSNIRIEDLENRAVISRDDAAKFLQAWLFFGMIRTILQVPIITADYVRDDAETGMTVITTSRLKDDLARWKADHDDFMVNDAIKLGERRRLAMECLGMSYSIWQGIVDFAGIVGPEVELSIQILATTLEHAVMSVYTTPEDRTSPWKPWISDEYTPWRRLTRNAFLTRRMVADGWCPSMIESFNGANHLAVQYYISLFGPPRIREHKECKATDIACREVTVNNDNYETLHVEQDCKCAFLMPDLGKLHQIVENDQIPILFLETIEGKTELKVVPQQRGIEYTAISHV